MLKVSDKPKKKEESLYLDAARVCDVFDDKGEKTGTSGARRAARFTFIPTSLHERSL